MPTFVFATLVQEWHTPGAYPGFQAMGAHLKKLRRTEGGAKMFGVFRVKNHDFTQKNHIFSNFRWCARRVPTPLDPPLHTKIKVMNSFLIRVAWVSRNTSLFFQVWYVFVFCFRSFVCCFSSFDISFVCF
jgi:hypothetical protein